MSDLERLNHNVMISPNKTEHLAVADPDLELKGGPGFVMIAPSAFLLFLSFSFFTQNRVGPGFPGASP